MVILTTLDHFSTLHSSRHQHRPSGKGRIGKGGSTGRGRSGDSRRTPPPASTATLRCAPCIKNLAGRATLQERHATHVLQHLHFCQHYQSCDSGCSASTNTWHAASNKLHGKNICSFHDKVKGAATDSTVSLQTCEVKPMTTPAPTPNAAQAEATSTGGHLYLRSAAGLQPEEAQPAADPEHTTNATDRYNTLPLLRALIALLHALLSHSACTATARQAAAQ